MDYWKEQDKQPSLEKWLNFWYGCVLCNCDHGCNEWIVKNASKAHAIISGLLKNEQVENLDKLVQRDILEVNSEFHKKVWDNAKKEQDSFKKDPS